MDYLTIIGIDVSKLTLDLHILPDHLDFQTENDENGFKKFIKWLEKDCGVIASKSLFAFECTGHYSFRLSLWMQKNEYKFVMFPGLEIKRSMGITRGKSDPTDAREIAEYTYLRRDKIALTQLPDEDIIRMNLLLSLRDKLVRQRAGFKATIKEAKRAFTRSQELLYFKTQESLVKNLDTQIKGLEAELQKIVAQNPKLQEQYDLIITIKGVGPLSAQTIIAVTHAFQKFPTWRKFACYCGIAPFPYKSGTSIRGRTKVSHLANKKMKSLLTNMASSAIQHNPEMKMYFQKRVKNGANKMATLNIIRNKLISRIFAVIERGTPYVDTLKYAA